MASRLRHNYGRVGVPAKAVNLLDDGDENAPMLPSRPDRTARAVGGVAIALGAIAIVLALALGIPALTKPTPDPLTLRTLHVTDGVELPDNVVLTNVTINGLLDVTGGMFQPPGWMSPVLRKRLAPGKRSTLQYDVVPGNQAILLSQAGVTYNIRFPKKIASYVGKDYYVYANTTGAHTVRFSGDIDGGVCTAPYQQTTFDEARQLPVALFDGAKSGCFIHFKVVDCGTVMPIESRCVKFCTDDMSVCEHPLRDVKADWAKIENLQATTVSTTNLTVENVSVSKTLHVATCVKSNNTWFPDDFMFGFGASAQQTEEQPPAGVDDYVDVIGLRGTELPPGNANFFYTRYNRTLDLVANAGSNAFRMSFSWGRIHTADRGIGPCPVGSVREPGSGCFDLAAIQRYVEIVNAARARGLKLVVTLVHYSKPTWLQNKYQTLAASGMTDGPLLHPESTEIFNDYVAKVVPYFLNTVDIWLTLNEPRVDSSLAYALPAKSPGIFDLFTLQKYLVSMDVQQLWNARAYDTIHSIYAAAGKTVRVSQNVAFAFTLPRSMWSADDVKFANLIHEAKIFEFEAAIRGRTYVADGSSRTTFGLKYANYTSGWNSCTPKMDFITLSAYESVTVPDPTLCTAPFSFFPNSTMFQGLWIQGGVFCKRNNPLRVYRLNGDIATIFLYEQLRELYASYAMPILIGENGYAIEGNPDEVIGDRIKTDTLIRTLDTVRRATVDGVPVIGYLHWTISDNWEFAGDVAGTYGAYYPRFGLVRVDGRNNSSPVDNLVYTPRNSYNAFKDILKNQCIPLIRPKTKLEIGDNRTHPGCPTSLTSPFKRSLHENYGWAIELGMSEAELPALRDMVEAYAAAHNMVLPYQEK